MSAIASNPALSLTTAEVKGAGTLATAQGLCAEVGGRRVLADIHLRAAPGTLTCITGPNGIGKTTLLRVLGRLTPLAGGALFLLGRRFVGRSLATPSEVRRGIGLVGHASMLYRDLTVEENLRFFGRLFAVANLDRRVETMMESLGVLDRRSDPVGTLSRGLVQRVAVARALLHEPSLVLADEPFTGLDTEGAARLETCLAEILARGGAVVMAEHDAGRCAELADQIVTLRDSRSSARVVSNGEEPN